MSIYYKEKVKYFNRAMESIWDEQTVKPDEIVLVQDGKLTDELYYAIDEWKNKLVGILKIIPLKENLGLGDALNIGMEHCSYELIARMDTDDISLPNRFEKQLNVFKNGNIDICSSWISEFNGDENENLGYRRLPEMHEEIIKYAKIRSPINHPAVMYKKSFVLKAGGYKRMIYFEDYYLWVRMILNKSRFYNLQEVLVKMRAGQGQIERRSGLNYAKNEFILLNEFRKNGFFNSSFEYLRNIIKIPIRFLPKMVIRIIYYFIRKL
ncbi:glycosyltransferase [Aliarcobacter trophiarum]|nr:glycosyltransferase [Aliarcobacter trophiarum]